MDFCNASVRSLSQTGGGLVDTQVLASGALSAPPTFGEDVHGELYVASLNSGSLFRIRALAPEPPPNQPSVLVSPGNQNGTEGDTLQVHVDGTLVLSASDARMTSGTIAAYAWGNSGSWFDDVVVDAP